MRHYTGKVVSSNEPFESLGLYWGYGVRVAQKFEDITDECPFNEQYDLKIGISDTGNPAEFADYRPYRDFRHALVFFGGLEGIEGILE